LEKHGGTKYPEAGYAQWKYLRSQAGDVVTEPEDVVASAERLEELLKRFPRGTPSKGELQRLAIEYGALREVREALERADDSQIFRWYIEGKPFLEYVAPLLVLEAKKHGLNHRQVAKLLVKAVKEGRE